MASLDIPSLNGSKEAKTEMKKVQSLLTQSENILYECSTKDVAEKIVEWLDEYLPENVGAAVIREKEVNCFQIRRYGTKERAEDERILQKRKRKLQDVLNPGAKHAKRRLYWARKKSKEKEDKEHQGPPKETSKRTKK